MCNEISSWVMLWEGRVYSTLYVLLAALPYMCTHSCNLYCCAKMICHFYQIYIQTLTHWGCFESLLPSREIPLEKLKLTKSAKNNCSPNLNSTGCVQCLSQGLQAQKWALKTLSSSLSWWPGAVARLKHTCSICSAKPEFLLSVGLSKKKTKRF